MTPRLLILVSAVVLVDTIFFAALTPLLPQYAQSLGLTKSEAGILTGAFALGVLFFALPSGRVAGRLGVKGTVLLGLGLTSAMSLAFGLLTRFWPLFLARLAGGVGSACSWTAAVSWLTARAPQERRGEVIGVTISAAVAGSLLGPVLGGLAAEIGSGPAFAAVAAAGLGLMGWVSMTPGPPADGLRTSHSMLALLADPILRTGLGLIFLSPLLFAVLQVLAPLELARLGWGARMLGGLYVVMAALEAAVHPVLGRWADRRGYREPVTTGLATSAAVLLAFALTDSAWPLATLVVLGGLAFGTTLVPGMALLSKTGEALGLGGPQALALTNFAWALGNAIGAPVGGHLAERAGDAVAYVTLAAVCLGALAWLWRPTPRCE